MESKTRCEYHTLKSDHRPDKKIVIVMMLVQEVNQKKAKMNLLNKLKRKISIAILSLSQAYRKSLIKSPRMTTKKTMKKKVKMTMRMPMWRRPKDFKIKDELHKGIYQTNNSATITANP